MQYIFIFLALIFFLAIVGWPLWLVIWMIMQKKKTGVFPWKNFSIIVIAIIVGIIVLGLVAFTVLGGVDKYFGMGSVNQLRLVNDSSVPSLEASSSGGIIILPDVNE